MNKSGNIVNFPHIQSKILKPCPFCGESVNESNVEQDTEICFVMCCNCGASGKPFNVKKLGAKLAQCKAIEAWNIRAYEEP